MRVATGIVEMLGALAVLGCAGCASQGGEQRTSSAAQGSEGQSAVAAESLSPERQDAIERIFARKATELQSCWSAEYEKSHNRKLEGDISVGLEIQPSGDARNVHILKSTINNADIEGCVTQQIGGWSFPEGQTAVPYMRTVHLGAQF